MSRNALRHGLYAERLTQFMSPEDKELFHSIPSDTDLEVEIALTRHRVVKYQTMLDRGEKWIYTKGKGGSHGAESESWSEGAVSVEELLDRASDLLRRLCATQKQMNPGKSIGGNMRLRIEVTGEAVAAAAVHDEAPPDLTDGSAEDAAESVPNLEADEPADTRTGNPLIDDVEE